MQFDQLLTMVNPMPRPPSERARRVVGLVEELEHLRQFLRHDADPGILHPDDEITALVSCRKPDVPPFSLYLAALFKG